MVRNELLSGAGCIPGVGLPNPSGTDPVPRACKWIWVAQGFAGNWQLATALRRNQAMSLAKRNEGAKVNSDINVTPMVDVMLVLLIIFMVITPMLQKGISVDMAKVNNPTPMQDADKEDALLVSVMRDGTVYFGADKIAVDSLTGKVKDRLASAKNKMVYVKADARAHFGSVVQVVDSVRAAGVDDLGLLTDQRKSTPNAPPAAPAGGQ
jgi:biopolymer transport protein ExbD/biopolymer transport protein TolR